jgi:kynurenine 3-monooxygenase
VYLFFNSVEMRHSVATPAYKFSKGIDNVLSWLTTPRRSAAAWYGDLKLSQQEGEPFRLGEPRGWLPLYTMVTFRPDVRYAVAKKKALRQGRTLKWSAWLGTTILGLASVGITFLTLSRYPSVSGG